MDALGKNMRMIARFRKGESLKHISHLDVQRTLQRALRRAGIPVAYSNGFNPHILISFATALGTGILSEAEWFDVELSEKMEPNAFLQSMRRILPEDLMVLEAFPAPDGFGTLSSHTRSSLYEACVSWDRPVDPERFQGFLEKLLSGEIIVQKRTKGGIRPVDIRPQIYGVAVKEVQGNQTVLSIHGRLQTDGSLRVGHLLDALADCFGGSYQSVVVRKEIYYESEGLLPELPQEKMEGE